MSDGSPYFDSPRHCLYAGWVMGTLRARGLEVYPVKVGGDYTDRFTLAVQGIDIELAVPDPPTDWTLP